MTLPRRVFAAALTMTFLAFAPPAQAEEAAPGGLPGYAGSETCGECHEEIFTQWSRTPRA